MFRRLAIAAVMIGGLGAAPALAHGYYYHNGHGNDWLGPAIGGLALGAIIGGAIAQSQQPPPPPVYYHAPPPPVVHHYHYYGQRPHCVEYRRWDPYRGMWFTTPDCRY